MITLDDNCPLKYNQEWPTNNKHTNWNRQAKLNTSKIEWKCWPTYLWLVSQMGIFKYFWMFLLNGLFIIISRE